MHRIPGIDPEVAADGRPRAFPIILSAMVPGLGQLVQRRWTAAAAFALLFAATLACFLFLAAGIILAFYRMGYDFEHYEPEGLPVLPAGILFFTALLVYAINVADAYRAYRRAASIRARRRFSA